MLDADQAGGNGQPEDNEVSPTALIVDMSEPLLEDQVPVICHPSCKMSSVYSKQGVCHELPGEANRTSKRKRGDMRNREYIEAIKEQTQNGK